MKRKILIAAAMIVAMVMVWLSQIAADFYNDCKKDYLVAKNIEQGLASCDRWNELQDVILVRLDNLPSVNKQEARKLKQLVLSIKRRISENRKLFIEISLVSGGIPEYIRNRELISEKISRAKENFQAIIVYTALTSSALTQLELSEPSLIEKHQFRQMLI